MKNPFNLDCFEKQMSIPSQRRTADPKTSSYPHLYKVSS